MEPGVRESQTATIPESTSEQPSAAGILPAPNVNSTDGSQSAIVNADSTAVISGHARFLAAWTRVREKRREVSAVITLALMALLWFDTGSGGSSPSPASDPDALDGYDAVLSDFRPEGHSAHPLRESAEPLATSAATASEARGLHIPHSDSSASAPQAVGRFGEAAHESAGTSANTLSAKQSSSEQGFDHPDQRKVRFAGRIQPAN